MNWRNRYEIPKPGDTVKVVKISTGDWNDVDWKKGRKLILVAERDGEAHNIYGKCWRVKSLKGEEMSNIYETEFEKVLK